MQILPIIKGAATWVPLLYRATRGSTGGTSNARYCYSVWLRDLVSLRDAGLPTSFRTVAELGPGDSLGIGLAAMLCGANHLRALDVVEYANTDDNLAVLREVRELFLARVPIPDDDEFPGVFPRLTDYRFPDDLLDSNRLEASLHPERVARIEAAIKGISSDVSVRYQVPWDSLSERHEVRADLIFSQAVFEHIEDIAAAYRALSHWLAPDGCMCHIIDFRSHKITPTWDGHLQYPAWLWSIVKGRRPYLLNREPAARHVELLQENGFQVVDISRDFREPAMLNRFIASEFRWWSEIDRKTAGAVILAKQGEQTQGNGA